MFLLKEKEIVFKGEINPEALFQLFHKCESFPVPKFQEGSGEMRRKFNRRDDLVTNEHLMEEALSSHNTLVL